MSTTLAVASVVVLKNLPITGIWLKTFLNRLPSPDTRWPPNHFTTSQTPLSSLGANHLVADHIALPIPLIAEPMSPNGSLNNL